MAAPLPCVVIAKEPYEEFKALFDAANLPVRYAVVHDPETAYLDGQHILPTEIPANVIWLTIEAIRGPARRAIRHLLANAPDLGLVQSIGAGYDMPMMQNILKRGVRLATSHVHAISIAEFVMRGVLDRFQRTDLAVEARARKEYPRGDFREIYRTTWMIYGTGAIGGSVAQRARGFGAHTIGVRRNPTGNEPVDEMIKPSEVEANLARADVFVFSAPISSATQGLINADFLARMKPGAVLCNVARAGVLDESALLASLDSGHLDYAFLDVHSIEEAWLYRQERMDDSPLWTHPKILLTPHAAGHGDGRHLRNAELLIANLRRYLGGENPLPDEAFLTA